MRELVAWAVVLTGIGLLLFYIFGLTGLAALLSLRQ